MLREQYRGYIHAIKSQDRMTRTQFRIRLGQRNELILTLINYSR